MKNKDRSIPDSLLSKIKHLKGMDMVIGDVVYSFHSQKVSVIEEVIQYNGRKTFILRSGDEVYADNCIKFK